MGRTRRTREYAEQAVSVFAGQQSPASHALTLVDLGMSYLDGHQAEPDRVGALVGEALVVGAQVRSEVVGRRAGDSLRAAGPRRDAAGVAEVAESVVGSSAGR